MDAAEYADSIRMDKPKTEVDKTKILHKRMLLSAFANTPLTGMYLIFSFFMITQYLVYTRPDPPVLWMDILAMTLLLIHTWLYGRLLRRYIYLEVNHFQNEVRKLGDIDDGKKDR